MTETRDLPTTKPRVRIAPSPTGPLHIGTARTALFNYLYAKRTGGTFVLRLEDTDQARGTVAFEQDILGGLDRLGIRWDEGPDPHTDEDHGPYAPYRQLARIERHRAAATRLLEQDLAYPCYCTPAELDADRKAQEQAHEPPRYVGRCANLTPEARGVREQETGSRGALRFRVPPGRITWDDLVRGPIDFDTANIGGDFVIVRSDGTPLYHFAVVVDDAEQEMTHIIRGEDHISNTPKHILLFRALGHEVPRFGHLPLILNPDRTKMSKRKSQTAISDYLAQGFVEEGIVNYLALLGWSPGGASGDEVLALEQLGERFDLKHVQKGGAVFDRERLEWLNGQWIRRLAPEDLAERLQPFLADAKEAGRIDRVPTTEEIVALLPIVQERLPRLEAVVDLCGFLWVDDVGVSAEMLVPKRWDAATTLDGLRAARDEIARTGAVTFEADELEPPLRALAEARGWKAGDLFMAVRVAVTGRTATPPLFDSLVAIGRDRVLARLDAAIAALAAVPASTGGAA